MDAKEKVQLSVFFFVLFGSTCARSPTRLLYRLLAPNGKGDPDECRLLLDQGALVNGERRDKLAFNTPLFQACRNGHVECVPLLLDYGADPNKPSIPEVGHPI